MSIRTEIATHLTNKRLFNVGSAIPGEEVARTMLVSGEIEAVLDPAKLAVEEDGYRLAHIRPQLDIYTSGGKLNVALDPRDKDKSAHLARTDPVTDEVWDIRCTDPNARIRVFGRFTEFNVFVALTWQYRENLQTEEDWAEELDRFKVKWRELFPVEPLFAAKKAEEYVSKPFKLV